MSFFCGRYICKNKLNKTSDAKYINTLEIYFSLTKKYRPVGGFWGATGKPQGSVLLGGVAFTLEAGTAEKAVVWGLTLELCR